MSNTVTFNDKYNNAVLSLSPSYLLSQGVLDLFLIPSKNPEEAPEVWRGLQTFFLNSSPCVKSCESSLGGLSLPRWQLVVGSSGVHLTQYWRWCNREPVAQQAATILRDLYPRGKSACGGRNMHIHQSLCCFWGFFFTHINGPLKRNNRKIFCWTRILHSHTVVAD